MKIKYKGREVDFRVSTLPTLFGRKGRDALAR